MELRDLVNRPLDKVRTVGKHCSCWECVNQMLNDSNEKKKRIVFKDSSQIILCLKHFMELMKLRE